MEIMIEFISFINLIVIYYISYITDIFIVYFIYTKNYEKLGITILFHAIFWPPCYFSANYRPGKNLTGLALGLGGGIWSVDRGQCYPSATQQDAHSTVGRKEEGLG